MIRPSFSIVVVSPPGFIHAHAFDDIATGLYGGLAELGVPAEIVRDLQAARGRPLVLGANLLSKLNRYELPEDAILFNLEQVQDSSHWITPDYLQLLRRYEVWDYSEQNIAALRRLGVPRIRLCQIGYADGLSRISPAPEDIDVLFYGSMNERRRCLLLALKDAGLRVAAAFGVYGQKRDALIARSKIVLNMHFFAAKVFEISRVAYLLANRRFVISESGNDLELEAPFRDGLILDHYQRLVPCCLQFVDRPDLRGEIADRGYALFRNRRQADFLRPLLAARGPGFHPHWRPAAGDPSATPR